MKLRRSLRQTYDFIVCGAGTSGSVVAARLAQQDGVHVLLLEAGGDDAGPEVTDPAQWPSNLGSERDWAFLGEPTPTLNGRRLNLNMGKVLGGSSSINAMVWSRGHKADWDHFAAESGDPDWGYQSILGYYRRIEHWQGSADSVRRGSGGPVYVAQPQSPQPVAQAMIEAATNLGIPMFDSPNGEMMEGSGGASIAELRIRDGQRQSMFRSYVYPLMDQPNLTVVSNALVSRLIIEGGKVTGVEALIGGQLQQFNASCETVLSLGAIHTPKVLMQSGIGPKKELEAHGIETVRCLPGVGQNHQDHLAFGCTWEYLNPQIVGGGGCEATLYWKSKPDLMSPDMLLCQLGFAVPSPAEVGLDVPEHGWTMFAGLAQPKSRGRVRLSGSSLHDPVVIEPNSLTEPEDLATAFATIELCRDVGNNDAFGALVKREMVPGKLNRQEMEQFIRNSAMTFWHQTCTAKMGRDDMAVVDHKLKVYGIENLRIADASIMPRITVGNTMAPCVVIGERAADIILAAHNLVSPTVS
ncbi:GMC family oxidoreductase [Phyllobacterium sp. CCNWLW183]